MQNVASELATLAWQDYVHVQRLGYVLVGDNAPASGGLSPCRCSLHRRLTMILPVSYSQWIRNK